MYLSQPTCGGNLPCPQHMPKQEMHHFFLTAECNKAQNHDLFNHKRITNNKVALRVNCEREKNKTKVSGLQF